jgi:voltage-gated sodium channel
MASGGSRLVAVPAGLDTVGEALPARLARIAYSPGFTRFILLAIGLTGILSGMETYPEFRDGTQTGQLVNWLQNAVLLIFVAEIAVKIGSFGAHPWRYFQVGWNLFDFAIVAVCLMPLHSEYVVVLRLLRTLRLFTALQGLQVLVTGLLKGIPSLGYVGLLLLLHFYIYAVIGTFAFGDNDPIRFRTLHVSMLTLFQVLTLEGWNDVLATQFLGSDAGYDDAWKALPAAAGRVSVARPLVGAAYFVSFIMIGTMIVLNLFTGVIIRSMEEAEEHHKALRKAAEPPPPPRQRELLALSEELQGIAGRLAALEIPPAEPPQRPG